MPLSALAKTHFFLPNLSFVIFPVSSIKPASSLFIYFLFSLCPSKTVCPSSECSLDGIAVPCGCDVCSVACLEHAPFHFVISELLSTCLLPLGAGSLGAGELTPHVHLQLPWCSSSA